MKKLLFIANPLSGGIDKKKLLGQVERTIRHPYEVAFTERPGHATELARKSDADIVVAMGGDGTVNEVASGLIGTDKVLGIIPCGSGDGLALHLGISRKPHRAAKTLNDGIITDMDCGLLDGKPFFCTAGVGLDADVAEKFESVTHRGVRSYISLAWKLWQHFHPETYTIDIDGEQIVTPAVIVTVANANQWGNQARIADEASVQDGLLNVVIVKPFRTWEIPILAAKLMLGCAHTSRRVETYTGKHISITRQTHGAAHFDGDPIRKGTHMEMEVVPNAIRVLVPRYKDI